jgi:translation elongation factor aEF-1 beta
MGESMVILKIMPEEPGIEDQIIKELGKLKAGKLQDSKKEPLAFGLFIIMAGIVIPNTKEGEVALLEAEVKKIKGVESVTVEGETLL